MTRTEAPRLLPTVADRAFRGLGLPFDAIGAGLFVLAGLHFAVTTLRTDRGWSQDIPAFYLAALGGLVAATLLALVRRRPLADARAFVAIAAGTMVFAYFNGKAAVGPAVEELGRPPALRGLYMAATAAFAAVMAWVVPVRPIEGYLTAALVFASPATRVLLRWAPDGFDVAPICLALAAVVHARALDTRPLRLTVAGRAALGFAAVVAVSALLGVSQQASIPAAARTAAQALTFVVAVDVCRRDGAAARFLRAAALVGLAVSAGEVFIYGEFVKLVGFESARQTRLEAFAIHPNLVAPFSAAAAVLGLGLAAAAEGRLWRVMGLTAFAAGAASVYLHHSGGATAGLIAGVALLTLNLAGARFAKSSRIAGELPAALLVAIPVMVLVVALAAPSFAPRLAGGGESGRINVGTRIEFWRAARAAITAHPLFGLGPKNVEAHAEFVDETIEANIDWSNHPHNFMVELAETVGLTGVVAFVLVLAGLARSFRRALVKGTMAEARLAAAGAAGLGVLLVDGFFDHGFAEFAVVSDLFWFCAIVIGAAEPAETLDEPAKGRPTMAVLSVAATIALWLGGLAPMICTSLEQSAKWIHFWTSQSQKLETFRDPEGRLSRFEAALWIAPQRADLRMSLADSLLATGRVQESIDEVDRAVKSAPYTSETLQRAAAFFCNLGNPPSPEHVAKSLALYKRTVKLGNPEERAQAHLGVARCLGLQGKQKEALDELAAALSINPQMPITVFGFRRVQPKPETPEPDAVYRIAGAPLSVTEAVLVGLDARRPKLDTDFETTWGPMARLTECLVHIGRVDLAVRELKIIESKAPTKRMNLPSMQAQAHIAARQYNDAIADFDRAIANGGWHPLMSSMRARALEGAGRVKEALQESQRFVEGQFDAHSYRSIAKDGYRRLAYSQQVASQYFQACESFVNAAIREDNPPERVRFYIDAATAAMRGSLADPAKSEQYLYFVDDCFVKACRETGSIEWGEYDHVKMVELGAQLARAAPGRGRAVFDRLLDLIQNQPSVGAFSLTLGAGLVASEQLKAQKKDEELAAHQMRLMALESVIEALGPRGMSRS